MSDGYFSNSPDKCSILVVCSPVYTGERLDKNQKEAMIATGKMIKAAGLLPELVSKALINFCDANEDTMNCFTQGLGIQNIRLDVCSLPSLLRCIDSDEALAFVNSAIKICANSMVRDPVSKILSHKKDQNIAEIYGIPDRFVRLSLALEACKKIAKKNMGQLVIVSAEAGYWVDQVMTLVNPRQSVGVVRNDENLPDPSKCTVAGDVIGPFRINADGEFDHGVINWGN